MPGTIDGGYIHRYPKTVSVNGYGNSWSRGNLPLPIDDESRELMLARNRRKLPGHIVGTGAAGALIANMLPVGITGELHGGRRALQLGAGGGLLGAGLGAYLNHRAKRDIKDNNYMSPYARKGWDATGRKSSLEVDRAYDQFLRARREGDISDQELRNMRPVEYEPPVRLRDKEASATPQDLLNQANALRQQGQSRRAAGRSVFYEGVPVGDASSQVLSRLESDDRRQALMTLRQQMRAEAGESQNEEEYRNAILGYGAAGAGAGAIAGGALGGGWRGALGGGILGAGAIGALRALGGRRQIKHPSPDSLQRDQANADRWENPEYRARRESVIRRQLMKDYHDRLRNMMRDEMHNGPNFNGPTYTTREYR